MLTGADRDHEHPQRRGGPRRARRATRSGDGRTVASYWSLPVVGETWDGLLNDIDGFHVRADHVDEALAAAAGGPVAEGNVGGGTGMVCHEFKGGIGTASRVVAGGARRLDGRRPRPGELRPARAAPGRRRAGRRGDPGRARCPSPYGTMTTRPSAAPGAPPGSGSIIVVVATDAPLLPHQCERLAQRAGLGIARMGGDRRPLERRPVPRLRDRQPGLPRRRLRRRSAASSSTSGRSTTTDRRRCSRRRSRRPRRRSSTPSRGRDDDRPRRHHGPSPCPTTGCSRRWRASAGGHAPPARRDAAPAVAAPVDIRPATLDDVPACAGRSWPPTATTARSVRRPTSSGRTCGTSSRRGTVARRGRRRRRRRVRGGVDTGPGSMPPRPTCSSGPTGRARASAGRCSTARLRRRRAADDVRLRRPAGPAALRPRRDARRGGRASTSTVPRPGSPRRRPRSPVRATADAAELAALESSWTGSRPADRSRLLGEPAARRRRSSSRADGPCRRSATPAAGDAARAACDRRVVVAPGRRPGRGRRSRRSSAPAEGGPVAGLRPGPQPGAPAAPRRRVPDRRPRHVHGVGRTSSSTRHG